jgi:hypothetical protein
MQEEAMLERVSPGERKQKKKKRKRKITTGPQSVTTAILTAD